MENLSQDLNVKLIYDTARLKPGRNTLTATVICNLALAISNVG